MTVKMANDEGLIVTSRASKRVEELDALRGLAVLLVVFFHFTLSNDRYNYFFELGTTGVDLFFIISGFVIFMSLSHIKNGTDFVINRISRLYPTYWASVTLTFILIIAFGHKVPFRQYLGNMTMFQFYLRIPDLDDPYWTMILEMVFYISIFAIYQLKAMRYLDVICVTVSLLTVTATRFFWGVQIVQQLSWWVPLLQFLPLFYAGTIFYRCYHRKMNQKLAYGLLLFCLLCQMALFPHAGRSRHFIEAYQYYGMLIAYFSLFTLAINGYLRFIVNPVSLFLGKISYALYLTHQYISRGILLPYLLKSGLNFWVASLITLIIVIGVAAILTFKIERPYSRMLKNWLHYRFNKG